jgi:hypothetical protein
MVFCVWPSSFVAWFFSSHGFFAGLHPNGYKPLTSAVCIARAKIKPCSPAGATRLADPAKRVANSFWSRYQILQIETAGPVVTRWRAVSPRKPPPRPGTTSFSGAVYPKGTAGLHPEVGWWEDNPHAACKSLPRFGCQTLRFAWFGGLRGGSKLLQNVY